MKVILLKLVPKVGERYAVKEVASGYARNVLFRQNLALPATPANLNKLKQWQTAAVREQLGEEELAETAVAKLTNFTVTMSDKANPEGHLFGSLNKEEVAAAILAETGIRLDPNAIILERPIKSLGLHTLSARLTGGREINFQVLVTPIPEK